LRLFYSFNFVVNMVEESSTVVKQVIFNNFAKLL